MERATTCVGRTFSKVLGFGALGLCVLGLLKFGPVLAGSDGPRQEIPYCPPPAEEDVPDPLISRSTILVSTLDGSLTALDAASGLMLWRHKTDPGPLLSSTISDYKFLSGGKCVQLIPTLDGDLYTFDGELMGGTPISAESLLSNTLKISDDVVITGGKEMKIYGIHRRTGQVLYTCGMDACKYSGTAIHDDEVLVIKRECRTVRAVSSLTGVEKWNYSVGQHDAHVVSPYTASGGCHASGAKHVGAEVLTGVRFAAAEGYMVVANSINGKEGHWDHNFESPIVRAWHIDGADMQQLDVFENNYHDAFLVNESDSAVSKPLIYLGTYNNQLYIMQSLNVLRTMALEWKTEARDLTSAPPLITWQPYLSTAVSRTPVIHPKPPDDTTVVIRVKGDGQSTAIGQAIGDYPFDSGFYVIKAMNVNTTPQRLFITDSRDDDDESIIVSLWYWWKEILGISLTFAILINVLVTHRFMKNYRRRVLSESNNQQRTGAVETPPSSAQSTNETSNSSEAAGMVTPPTDFVSRYFTDFEPVQTLGKGGFGVVFKARNKMDDCDYAIKRISMSQKNDSKERIMREVKALAKLDHVGIVRYYNSWLESPPTDWRQPVEDLDDSRDVWTPSSVLSADDLHSSFAQAMPANSWVIGDSKDTSSNNNVDAKNWRNSNLGPKNHSPFLSGDSLDTSNTEPTDSEASFRATHRDTSGDSFIRFESPTDASVHQESQESTNNPESRGTARFSIQFKGASESSHVPEEAVDVRGLPLATSAPSQPSFKSYLYIQMQLCRKDSLRDWLRCHTSDRDKFETLDYFYQIVSAVEYVHEQGLMHRDLKPSNIFFAMDGAIKIGDFGLVATMSACEDTYPNELQESLPPAMSQKHTNQVGTRLYMSPEQLAEATYDHKVDIFSLGLILFELLVPFGTEMERMKVMTQARERKFPRRFVEEMSDEHVLVNKMLSHNCKDRPCAAEIRQDPILQDYWPRPNFLRKVRSRSMSRTYSTSSSTSSGNSGNGMQAGT